MNSHVRIKIVKADDKKLPFWLGFLRASLLPLVLFLPGLIADSAAMQWAGFVALIFCFFAASIVSAEEWLTVNQARKRLDDLASK
ncbi:DUF2069 domain-containing protein [Paracoccus marcusii]|uniref:DUF2069 domain-containing protein n=1 Tax=Paracoccus marcusii TaxID=59779 RepID=UPI0024921BBA|nr:DUF2069 domain-containing protein [Paracoccus marcusii]